MENKKTEVYDVLIIGSGAAGYSAGIYAGRYLMKTLIVTGDFGGETATAGTIENWPGSMEIDGFELMHKMKEQAKSLGTDMVDGLVTEVKKDGDCFSVKTSKDEEFFAKTVIYAHGSRRRHLGLVNEKELTGKGVHYCATCDGPVYTGKTIAIVGGGDASVKGANLSAEYVDKIYLIVRGDKIKAEPINREEMDKLGDKVEVLFETEVKEIIGEKKLEKVLLSKEFNGSNELVIDGLFIEIGAEPNTKIAEDIGVELDQYGYLKVNNMMETNVPGAFAAGDTTNHFGSFKQIVTAAAQGAVASTSAYNYYKKHGELCQIHFKPIGAHDEATETGA